MRSRVKRIKEMISASSEDKKPGGNPVVLLTAHGSKGLEFDEVWILGPEDGVFPDESSGRLALGCGQRHPWVMSGHPCCCWRVLPFVMMV
mgnify:CR=1 FL=1